MPIAKTDAPDQSIVKPAGALQEAVLCVIDGRSTVEVFFSYKRLNFKSLSGSWNVVSTATGRPFSKPVQGMKVPVLETSSINRTGKYKTVGMTRHQSLVFKLKIEKT